jgi:hypothetical protein
MRRRGVATLAHVGPEAGPWAFGLWDNEVGASSVPSGVTA